jgi:pimeloyl-ACP methyl ester carboxylesterase
MTWSYELVPMPDGRGLEVLMYGEGIPLVFLSGTPGAAVPNPRMAALADRCGLRVIQPNRPGYGQSDPNPGRRIVDVVPDVQAVLEHLGLDAVVVAGGSGGGPHALAMAAELPQCRAAAVMVSPAPRDAEGLDFYDGMAESNQEEWRLADVGADAVLPLLEKVAVTMRVSESPAMFLEQYGDCIPACDRVVYAQADPAVRAAGLAKAVARGVDGWLEDDLAMTSPWGFALESITTPVTFWAGRQDLFISYRHTTWMAERLPGADVHLLADEGHFGPWVNNMDAIVLDLLRRGRLS